MDFRLNDEQRMLRDSVRRWVDREYTFEERRRRAAAGSFSRETWQTIAEQGWLGAGLPESAGGFGGGPVEAGIVLEACGRGIVLEPVLVVGTLAARTLMAGVTPAQQGPLLEALLDGSSVTVLAHQENGQEGAAVPVRATARRQGDGSWVLGGSKLQVLGGAHADLLLVSARTSGAAEDEAGISLFAVPASAQGLTRQVYKLIDETPVADVHLDNVVVPADALLGQEGQAFDAIDQALGHAVAGLCAMGVGAMERVLEITTEYLRTRKQFGVAIGTFQALQHRLADMLIELEQARAMAWRVTAYVDAPRAQRRHAVAAAKVQLGRSGHFVGAQGIQLHGGIGVTEEYVIGHYFKVLRVAETLFGNTQAHLRTLATLNQAAAAA